MTETPNDPAQPPVEPKPSKSKSAGEIIRRVVSAVLTLGVIAGIGSFAYDKLTSADRDETGAVTSQGKVDVTDLKAGDCVVENLSEGEFTRVKVAPCSKPHYYETFATFELADGDFPGEQQVDDLSGAGCVDRFAAFVGVSFDQSKLAMTYMSPVESGWSMDRGVACLLTEDAATKGSLKGAKR